MHPEGQPQPDPRLDLIVQHLNDLKQGLSQMSGTVNQLDQRIADLTSDVTNLTGAVSSSNALITGFAAALAEAIAAAGSAGATDAELQSLTDLHTAITAQTTALSDAVAANPLPGTPTPTTP